MSIGALVVMLLLALVVRLWFDIAQVRAVAQNESRMWRNTWRAWRITWHDLRHLYRMYICISFVAWATLRHRPGRLGQASAQRHAAHLPHP